VVPHGRISFRAGTTTRRNCFHLRNWICVRAGGSKAYALWHIKSYARSAPIGEKHETTDRLLPCGGLWRFRRCLCLRSGAGKLRRTNAGACRCRRHGRANRARLPSLYRERLRVVPRERWPQDRTRPAAHGRPPRRRLSDVPDRNWLTWSHAGLRPGAADRRHPGDHRVYSQSQAVSRKPHHAAP